MGVNKKLYDAHFLKQFTLAVIRSVEEHKYHISPGSEIVDADLIPELSRELALEYELREELLNKYRGFTPAVAQQERTPSPMMPVALSSAHKRVAPVHSAGLSASSLPAVVTDSMNGWEKIAPIMNDRSVSRIQCIGHDKPLAIVRTGRREMTKLALSEQQIVDVFTAVSDLAHIPLIEGPFHVELDAFSAEGVHSSVAQNRFIIEKRTAYSLLEGGAQKRVMPSSSGPSPTMRR